MSDIALHSGTPTKRATKPDNPSAQMDDLERQLPVYESTMSGDSRAYWKPADNWRLPEVWRDRNTVGWARARDHLARTIETQRQLVQSGRPQQLITTLAPLLRPATRDEIAKHVAALLGCFSINRAEVRLFTKMLILDIEAAQPSAVALERGLTRVRRTAKFTPSIGEVLDAIRGADEPFRVALKTATDLIEKLPGVEREFVELCRARDHELMPQPRIEHAGDEIF
jgi:hypothetical protein